MENFILISPQFPHTYWQFAYALKKRGVNVLGIGNAPYHELSQELKTSLTEYYYCPDMDNYQSLYKAVAFFAFKYGKIDYLESNNEYWLMKDALLRTDFHITTGLQASDMDALKRKSGMKAFFKKAKIKCAPYKVVRTFEDTLDFVATYGYPLFIKPDIGVGANDTARIDGEETLKRFFDTHLIDDYIIEPFIQGTIVSFDGVCDEHSQIVFATSHVFPCPNDVIVNDHTDDWYYTLPSVPEDIAKVGPKVIEAFNIKKRIFHLEFFRLSVDHPGIGKAGTLVGLEINMRPPGGYTPDMINFANSINLYEVWAEVVLKKPITENFNREKYYVMETSRRDRHAGSYVHTAEEILTEFKPSLMMYGRYPAVLASGLGDIYFVGRFINLEDALKFKDFVLEKLQ